MNRWRVGVPAALGVVAVLWMAWARPPAAYGQTASPTATATPAPAMPTAHPAGALRFENNDPAVTFGGAWTPTESAQASGGSVHRSNQAAAAVQFTFISQQVTWVTSRGPNRGIARVLIDGNLVDTVDLFLATERFAEDRDFRNLAPGTHVIRIEVTGTRGGAATDSFVDVDAFVADGAPTTPIPTAAPTATPPAPAATGTATATAVATGTTAATAAPATPAATTAPPPPAGATAVRDQRYFVETSYRIDHNDFWDYFNARGGVRTFGFPISRTFTFLGCTTQVFQRQLLQQCPGTGVRTMNLLDPELMPYNQINFSTFPAHDPAIAGAAPAPGSAGYGEAVLRHVQSVAPDSFEGLPTRFFSTFVNTVPGVDPSRDPDFAALVNLEVWGFPTSGPAYDPSNQTFVYIRFQRGIMHFRAQSGTTEGILLADYFKSLLTGRNLPPDLAAQAAASPFLAQYCPGNPAWVCRPLQIPDTDLTFAFETQ